MLDTVFFSAAGLVLAIVLLAFWRDRKRAAFIDGYAFHPAISRKVAARYPQLSEHQLETVFTGLRSYFQLCRKARRRTVAMPSQAVDVAWHEFILFTKAYEQFSRRAIGRFLHHTPTEAMSSPTQAQQGIKRAWRLACAEESINPKTPSRLPLLFAIDGDLGIEDGFRYVLDCSDPSRQGDPGYCAGHIGCASGCSGDSGGSDCGGSSCSGGGCGGD